MSMKSEVQVVLNRYEIGILLSALQLLTRRDENLIAREHGPALPLYDRLNELYSQIDCTNDHDTYCSDASY